MTQSAETISIIVPLYNEEDSVPVLVERIVQVMRQEAASFELLLVNDGSQDATYEAMVKARQTYGANIRLIDLSRNFGQTAAMQAGIDLAEGEIIVTMDGDLQNDPADIPLLVQDMQRRNLDLIQGWRKNRQDGFFLRKVPSRIANWLIRRLTGIALHDYGCSLKAYRAYIIKQVRLYGEMHRFIPIWATSVTSPNRVGEIEVRHHSRQFGTSKYGLSRTFRVIIDLISVYFFQRFRARPSHFFGLIGLGFGTLGGLILSYLFTLKLVLGQDIGDRPLLIIAVLLIMISMQFLTTGVISEMLSRIYFTQDKHSSYAISERSMLAASDEAQKVPQSSAPEEPKQS